MALLGLPDAIPKFSTGFYPVRPILLCTPKISIFDLIEYIVFRWNYLITRDNNHHPQKQKPYEILP